MLYIVHTCSHNTSQIKLPNLWDLVYNNPLAMHTTVHLHPSNWWLFHNHRIHMALFWKNSVWRVLQADVLGIGLYNSGRVGVCKDMPCSVPVGCKVSWWSWATPEKNIGTSNSPAFPVQLHLASSQCTFINLTSLRRALSGKTCM